MKTVYMAMSADIIHQGHLNVINEARKLGDVIVGLHTDDVIRGYWRNPIMKYDERKEVIENIKGVIKVIPQDTLDQVPNILKPELLIKIISNMLCMAHQVVFNKFKFSLIK